MVATVLGGQIYVSENSGTTWLPKLGPGLWWAVASSADGTKIVIVSKARRIFTSPDFGNSWTVSESDRDWESVASSADGTKLVAAVSGGQIYTNSPSGGRNSFIELVYIGGGQFFIVNQR